MRSGSLRTCLRRLKCSQNQTNQQGQGIQTSKNLKEGTGLLQALLHGLFYLRPPHSSCPAEINLLCSRWFWMLQLPSSFPLIKAQNILLVARQSPPRPPFSPTNGSFHDLQQGSFNLWRMEISVFVYRRLLPFISKLCIWREDLMPLFAEEQMFKDPTESTFSRYNFRLWNSKTPWAPRCGHSCPTHPAAPPAACSHCGPTVWGQQGPTFTFCLCPAHPQLEALQKAKAGQAHPAIPLCQGKLQQDCIFGLWCNQTWESWWNTDGCKRHK